MAKKKMLGIAWGWHFNESNGRNGIIAKPSFDSGRMSEPYDMMPPRRALFTAMADLRGQPPCQPPSSHQLNPKIYSIRLLLTSMVDQHHPAGLCWHSDRPWLSSQSQDDSANSLTHFIFQNSAHISSKFQWPASIEAARQVPCVVRGIYCSIRISVAAYGKLQIYQYNTVKHQRILCDKFCGFSVDKICRVFFILWHLMLKLIILPVWNCMHSDFKSFITEKNNLWLFPIYHEQAPLFFLALLTMYVCLTISIYFVVLWFVFYGWMYFKRHLYIFIFF